MNLRNQTLIDTVDASDLYLRFAPTKPSLDIGHSFLGELGVAVQGASQAWQAVFQHGVSAVVGPGSEEQVLDVDAERIITLVADGNLRVVDRPMSENPGETMSTPDPSVVANNSVSITCSSTDPFNAARFAFASTDPEILFSRRSHDRMVVENSLIYN